jgi:Methyltransferase domain
MRLPGVGGFLDRRAPALARVLRPAWHRVTGRPSYWARRAGFVYYRVVVELARAYVPPPVVTGWHMRRVGRTVLDVGARDTHVLLALDWFPRRVALDLQPGPSLPGIERSVADFRDWTPRIRFDLVLCLEVLEHLDDPAAFFRQLYRAGQHVIVSVPYRWPRGTHPAHVQDPVDEAKLIGWAGQPPLESRIVMDDRERLVAVFKGPDRA